jgi:hypothetical protein
LNEGTAPFSLAPEAYAELVRRLVGLRGLAEGLRGAFDDEAAANGAEEMLESIDRTLDLLAYRGSR